MAPEVLEDDIVTQLQSAISVDVADVIPLPQDDGSNSRPSKKAQIIVAYDNSEYKEALSTLPMAQEEWIEFVVTIRSRTLRGDTGIYTMFAAVKLALIGFVPTNCEVPISGKWFGFPDVGTKGRIDEVWTYEFHLRTKSTLIQDMVEDSLNQGIVDSPTVNPNLTINAQLVLPNPLPEQGLDDTNSAIILLIEG